MNRVVPLFILALLAASCTFLGKGLVKNENVGGALGTSYSIIYLSDKELDFQREIDSVFQVVNQSLSTYIPTSDISRINQGDSTIVVDGLFRDVFGISKVINQKTNGYFDPTVGALVNAWGFGPGPEIEMDSAKVDSLLNFVGLEKVFITDTGTIRKSNPNIYLDFNAIAKGYAIDCLARMMDKKGIKNYLLEVGGELVAKGENAIKGKPWVVGIDDPQVEEGRALKILIHLKDKALASSGNYRKFKVNPKTGMRYVHTIDPKTGFTKAGNTLGVTILADTCAEADAYATAFMAMDLDDALKLISQEKQIEGYIIYLDGKGQTREFMTAGFKELVVK